MSAAAMDGPPAQLRSFRPYPSYKDSGVDWLEKIPAHWDILPLKRIGDLQAGAGFPDNEQGLTTEEIPFFKVGDMGMSGNEREMREFQHTVSEVTARRLGAFMFPPQTIVFAKVGAALLLNRRRLLVRRSCMDNNMMGFMPAHCDPAWALYWLSGLDMGEIANPGAVPSVNEGQMRETPTIVPPKREQLAIAIFLDRETAKIDALVAKKERLIDLLHAERTALITRAITKGLNQNVPKKGSDTKWLGEIPAHWEIKRLWHLTPSARRIMYGIVLPGPNVDDGVPIIKGGDVSPERLRLNRLNRTTREIESAYVRSRVRGGDLVYAIRGSIGEVAIVPHELEGANLTQDAARIAYTSATHGPWLLYVLKSTAVFAQLEAGALGATIRGINIRDLKRASVPVPPQEEQRAIAAFLDSETARIDALVAKVRDGIQRLRELRAALISAAVTGKIDVREEVT